MGFPINFPQHRKMQPNLLNWENLGNWYPYFPQRIGTVLPSGSNPMAYFTTWEKHGISHHFPATRENAVNSTL